MPHALKGQRASMYRPSATRRNSGLSPIAEKRAVELWNKLRQAVKKTKISPSKKYNTVQKGRFTVMTPVRYSSAKKGRFEVLTRLPPSRFSVSTKYFK